MTSSCEFHVGQFSIKAYAGVEPAPPPPVVQVGWVQR